MKECEPDESPPSPPSGSNPKKYDHSVNVFNRAFCYIVETFFTIARNKEKLNEIDMKRPPKIVLASSCSRDITNNEPSEQDTSSANRIESVTKKTRKCRLPVLIRKGKQKNALQSSNMRLLELPSTSRDNSVTSVSKSSSCHLAEFLPVASTSSKKFNTKDANKVRFTAITSDRSIQTAQQKRVKIDPNITKKPSQLSSQGIQVGSRPIFDVHTSLMEILPVIHGDSLSNTRSPISLEEQSSGELAQSSSASITPKKPVQKKRTYRNLNTSLHQTNSPLSPTQSSFSKDSSRCLGALSDDSSRSLKLPPSLKSSGNISPAQSVASRTMTTISSQTMESWPVIQKRLSMFEKSKNKLSKKKSKTSFASTYVQAVTPPVKKSNVKCLVYVEQDDKTTQARLLPSGMERVESYVNTEKSDSNSGIQCDIAFRKKPSPRKSEVTAAVSKKSNLTATDQIQPSDIVTVLPSRNMDPRVTKSENVANFETAPEKAMVAEDPLQCLSDFLSLEHMLQRLQDEIRGLDKSIRHISNSYRFPATLGSSPRGSFDSKIKSAENMVKRCQRALEGRTDEIPPNYRSYSYGEY